MLIYIPDSFDREKSYIINLFFNEFLGISVKIEQFKQKGIIRIQGDNGYIEMPDVFFSISEEDWLTEGSLPVLPLDRCHIDQIGGDFNGRKIPVIYGRKNEKGEYFSVSEKKTYIGIDIFGSAFFMLTRYEEYVNRKRDAHDRFPVEESIAYKEGFLTRPIINEYIEILWQALKFIFPRVERKLKVFKVIPTHDIDRPLGMLYESPLQILRHTVGDVLYRRSFGALCHRLKDVFRVCFSSREYINEKLKTYEFIVDQSKRHGLQNIFFFMNSKQSWYDGNYKICEPKILNIIKTLVKEGHLIGLHPSFVSYMDKDEILHETKEMNDILEANGLPKLAGARQHYLKWKNPYTWRYYEDAEIAFDSTMTFAGHVGFRVGICYPYPVYDLLERKQLDLIERPLIVMDATLYDYMKVSHNEALDIVKKLADECKKYNGEFVVLWHNTTLEDEKEKAFYAKMMDEIC